MDKKRSKKDREFRAEKRRKHSNFRDGRTLYLHKKKSNKIRVWTAVDRNRLRFAAFEIGDVSGEALKKILNRLSNCFINIICTDGNFTYHKFIPSSIQHFITKSETCLVEAYNSVLRHYLARLQRKTKCYSKSAEMLRLSVLLLIHKFNSQTR